MNESESQLFQRFKAGDREAANQIIGQFYERVVNAARKRLEGGKVRATSEEDIAASVFESLWQRADENRFSENELGSSDDLWKLLCAMVRFKATDHIRRENRDKRGGGQLRGESIFANAGDAEPGQLQDFAVSNEALSQIIEFREQHQVLMDKLDDPELQEIATMRLEGYKVLEIKEHFGRSERWVKRKLALIRELWSDDQP